MVHGYKMATNSHRSQSDRKWRSLRHHICVKTDNVTIMLDSCQRGEFVSAIAYLFYDLKN
ncbi:MAG: hypothetical protein HWQ37_06960 [Nostoc sp. NMS4]|nr:hypothetical protein [Nostoc sp. NMS4]